MIVAVEKKVIAHRQKHVNVTFEGDTAQKLNDARLFFRVILGEEFLELIDDEQRLFVPVSPSGDHRDCPIAIADVDKLSGRFDVAGKDRHQPARQRRKRLFTRLTHDHTPALWRCRNYTCTDERALPHPGWSNYRQ